MNIYDYLFSAIIMIALLLGSTLMVTTLSSPASNASDRDVLKVTAEKIMTQMLLDPGYPYNWGSNNTPPQDMAVFGLAKYGQTSREAYILDPDKVLRLNRTLQGNAAYYFPASVSSSPIGSENYTASNLLNLGKYHSLDYGFTLEFNEPLQINFNPTVTNDVYPISVTSEYNLPIIGAKVSATLYYKNSSNLVAQIGPIINNTVYDGSCILDLSGGSTGSAKVLVVVVDYYGIHAVKFRSGTDVLNATLFTNTLLSSSSQPYTISSGADVRELILIQSSLGYVTTDFKVENSGNTTSFVLNNAPEPSVVAVLAISGNNLVVASRDFSMISYRTIPTIKSASATYSIERSVLIGGATFTATLYFWRMSS